MGSGFVHVVYFSAILYLAFYYLEYIVKLFFENKLGS
jgi:hypothetical protein